MLVVVGSDVTVFKREPTTPNMSQHIATRWPNVRNMLRQQCCVGMLGSFGRGLKQNKSQKYGCALIPYYK